MEVFISSGNYDEGIRASLTDVVFEAWEEIDVLFTMQHHSLAGRFPWAEAKSKGEFYGNCDDDCIPHPSLRPWHIESLFRSHPDYATIGMMNLLAPVKGEGLVEAHAVGGIRFIRKGVVTEFPADFNGDDSAYYDLVRAKGFKQGIITTYPFLHLGLWHST